ncbi:MAG: histidine phosphatase family protein, partial [Lysobacterales bacterium]
STHGRAQATLLGVNLRARAFQPAFAHSGTLLRQRDTLALALLELEAPPVATVDADWDEIDAVALLRAHAPEHENIAALRRALANDAAPERAFLRMFAHALSRWQGGDFEREYHETWPAFRARVARALRHAIERTRDMRGDSLIVTSGGVIATACAIALDLPDARVFPLNLGLANVGITRFAIEGEALRIVTLNDFGWLETHDPAAVTYR